MRKNDSRNNCSPFLALLLASAVCSPAAGQFFVPRRPVTLTGDLQLEQLDAASRAHWERAQAFLEAGEIDDGVEIYLRLIEEHGSVLAPVDDPSRVEYPRFVPLRQAVSGDLGRRARQSPEVLRPYRRRADPLAERLQSQGELQRVVEELFLCTGTDQALDALAQQRLRAGRYAEARHYWEQIFLGLRSPNLGPADDVLPDSPLWLSLDDRSTDRIATAIADPGTYNLPTSWTAYPDSQLELATIRARLVLTSILEGDLTRSQRELTLFSHLHGTTTGVWQGRTVVLAQALQDLLAASRTWEALPGATEWPTFAADNRRNSAVAPLRDLQSIPLWRVGLRTQFPRNPFDGDAEREFGFPASRPGDPQSLGLPFFPVAINGHVYVSDGGRLRGFRAIDGTSATSVSDEGEIYPLLGSVEVEEARPGRIGFPRFTLSSDRHYLATCLGSPVTIRSPEVLSHDAPQQLIVIDLATQRLVWLLPTGGDEWRFDGGPIVDQGRVYVAMRRGYGESEVHVACFEIATQRMAWRTQVCAGVSLAGSELPEITHNLLCLYSDHIFVNTNLGAVAAIDRRDGQIEWLVKYPRLGTEQATETHPAWHVTRDLAPCLYDRGMLYIAPMDCPQIFCLDALSGQLVWETNFTPGVLDANQLVGVAGDHLVVAGRRIWWLDRRTGRLSSQVPQNPFPATPSGELQGSGRAILAGQTVYWPTTGEYDAIYLLNGVDGQLERQPIRMPEGQTLGNLCAADGLLFVTTANELYALDGRPTISP